MLALVYSLKPVKLLPFGPTSPKISIVLCMTSEALCNNVASVSLEPKQCWPLENVRTHLVMS